MASITILLVTYPVDLHTILFKWSNGQMVNTYANNSDS
ncbi:hypothetical protein T01_3014 [Trichinella spiralis]|uniref:Uncharacterized protein n=1 Tax=Trichinella spiralis TaxID=6334 RepID=A0A0V1AIL1_TRISP|nr:hypothetical protein T01_3014 [Trichinella spiralis]